uniref:C-type lectin domain-containing protein n=1 Tax=Terrapene triunguis TaxID=2587831 RepID=A0A674J6F9_9SAUR
DGESTTTLGKLFQWLITLTGKNVHLISNLNLSSFNFQPLDHLILLHLTKEGKCYWFSKDSKNWKESRNDCSAKSSQKLVIQDQEEMVK